MCERRGEATVAEGALALIASFAGDLFDRLEQVPLVDLEQPQAFNTIVEVLDKYFQYRVEVRQPERIEKFIN
eukprot:8779035-Prorocentrum_lima.AAC.1